MNRPTPPARAAAANASISRVPTPLPLVVVADDEGDLRDGWIGLVAHEPGVGHHGPLDAVGQHPHEVMDVVDLEEVAHQRGGRWAHRLESAVQGVAGELDRPVHDARVVAGQDGPQV